MLRIIYILSLEWNWIRLFFEYFYGIVYKYKIVYIFEGKKKNKNRKNIWQIDVNLIYLDCNNKKAQEDVGASSRA